MNVLGWNKSINKFGVLCLCLAVSLMDKSHNDWRRLILASLLQRNCQEKGGFVKLIASRKKLGSAVHLRYCM